MGRILAAIFGILWVGEIAYHSQKDMERKMKEEEVEMASGVTIRRTTSWFSASFWLTKVHELFNGKSKDELVLAGQKKGKDIPRCQPEDDSPSARAKQMAEKKAKLKAELAEISEEMLDATDAVTKL